MRLFNQINNPENKIYYKIVTFSRNPFFFRSCNIQDNFEGRFELLVLHLSLILWIMKTKENNEILTQNLIDRFFEDMDASLRELGVSDLSVGKKIKVLAEKFYGRLTSYSDGFENIYKNNKTELLSKSIRKNLYLVNNVKRNLSYEKKISEKIQTIIVQSKGKLNQLDDLLNQDILKI